MAICTEPVGVAADGSKQVTFRWIVQNDDGTEPTRTVVRWRVPTDNTWTQLLDTTEPVYEFAAAANTFPAGPIQWGVKAYNKDSAAGPESLATFICLVAPDAPAGLTATAVPLTTVSWQATGQEAYEVSVDGAVTASGFGSNIYSWTAREPLDDGAHTIRVRIQGKYGYWSDYASTQILVVNAPKGSIDLDGQFGTDAALFWTYSGSEPPATVAVYRDGVWIGTANPDDLQFVDRVMLGQHVYRVEYWYSDGNYTRSADLSGVTQTDTLLIAPLSGGAWMSLKLSENSDRNINMARGRKTASTYVTGSEYPVLEWSQHSELSGSFDCAFRTAAEASAFERLLGSAVILKMRDGTVLIGGLTEIRKSIRPFYIAYTFSIAQMSWEDFVHGSEIN